MEKIKGVPKRMPQKQTIINHHQYEHSGPIIEVVD